LIDGGQDKGTMRTPGLLFEHSEDTAVFENRDALPGCGRFNCKDFH
jgi:hypothetical protein